MNKINLNLNDIEIKFDGMGDYGIHDGFFNAIAVIDGEEYDFQCCSDGDESVDFNDCGHDWGLSGEANEKIAKKIGEENVLYLLKKAYEEYTA